MTWSGNREAVTKTNASFFISVNDIHHTGAQYELETRWVDGNADILSHPGP